MDRGIGKIMSIWWFTLIFLVAGTIIYMVLIYYGSPYNVQGTESEILGDQVENCLVSQGYLNPAVFTSDFKKNFLSDCHLNFSVENVYDWKSLQQYYVEVNIYKFDQNNPGLLGDQLLNLQKGNINIKTAWNFLANKNIASSPPQRDVTTIVIHSTEGSTVNGALETISNRELSIHYLIDQAGNIYSNQNPPAQYASAFVPESQVASQAGCGIGSGQFPLCTSSSGCIGSNGLLVPDCQQLAGNLPKSQWCCIEGFNPKSIGIELVNRGNITGLCKNTNYKGQPVCLTAVSAYGDKWESFSSNQINSLVNLVSELATKYNIPLDRNHIIGHYQITTYKTDPGPAFPWTEFMNDLQERGVSSASSQLSDTNERQRSFYVTDKSGNQYIVTVLALVRKTEKNVA